MQRNGQIAKALSIRIPCPSGEHPISIDTAIQHPVVIPESCPVCAMGLPGAFRVRIREILNIARFQGGQSHHMDEIEIVGA